MENTLSGSTSENRNPRRALAWLATCALALAALYGCRAEPEAAAGIVLITVDTLRADHVGAYGAKNTATPHIDQLAREGITFEHAVTPMPLTRPAHFSILTSRYPREHGVVNNALSLPSAAVTLAERFSEAGWATAGFTGVALLSRASGAAQGFSVFSNPSPEQKHRRGVEVVDEALAWLKTIPRTQPYFLWVHLFDPHLPYEAKPTPGTASALDGEYPVLSWRTLREIAATRDGDLPMEIVDHGLALYRREVEYTDAQIGRLLAGIDRRSGSGNVVVAFTADHGECFERRVFFEHADCLYRGATRIPLILRDPAHFAPGTRARGPASSLDLAPTLLSIAGLAPLANASGSALDSAEARSLQRSLLLEHPLYQPRVAQTRVRRAERIRSVGGVPLEPLLIDEVGVGVVNENYKYLRRGDRVDIFRTDALESEIPATEQSAVAAELKAVLDALLQAHPLVVIDPGEINAGLRATLEALGYLVPAEDAGGAAP